MTPAQYNEYQRQAEVLEQHKRQLIHDQIDQLQDEINYCLKADMPHHIPGLRDSIEQLKEQLRHG
jgi:hypothetical protein